MGTLHHRSFPLVPWHSLPFPATGDRRKIDVTECGEDYPKDGKLELSSGTRNGFDVFRVLKRPVKKRNAELF